MGRARAVGVPLSTLFLQAARLLRVTQATAQLRENFDSERVERRSAQLGRQLKESGQGENRTVKQAPKR